MKRSLMFLIVLISALIGGCSKEDVNPVPEENAVKSMSFVVTQEMIDEWDSLKEPTLVTDVKLSTLKSGGYDFDADWCPSNGINFSNNMFTTTLFENYLDYYNLNVTQFRITAINFQNGSSWDQNFAVDQVYNIGYDYPEPTILKRYITEFGDWSDFGIVCNYPNRDTEGICDFSYQLKKNGVWESTVYHFTVHWTACPFNINWAFELVSVPSGYMRIKVNNTVVVNATTNSSGTIQVKVGDEVFVEVYSAGYNGNGGAVSSGSISELNAYDNPYASATGTAIVEWKNGAINGFATP